MFTCHEDFKIEGLVGQTFVAVTGNKDDEEMAFVRKDGTKFVFYHSQDCCEDVRIEDVIGDLSDLVGVPIVQAEEVTRHGVDGDHGMSAPHGAESYTWTFYKFASVNGSVTVRWFGSSNGYYSEDVCLRVEQPVKKVRKRRQKSSAI